MNKNRMTLEEMRELKPSLENPVTLTCDDGYYIGEMKEIKVIAVGDKAVLIKDLSGMEVAFYRSEDFLKHYPSFKKEKKLVEGFKIVNLSAAKSRSEVLSLPLVKTYGEALSELKELAVSGNQYRIAKVYVLED